MNKNVVVAFVALFTLVATACTAEVAPGPGEPVDSHSEVAPERSRDPLLTGEVGTEMDKLKGQGYKCTQVAPGEGYRCELGELTVYCNAAGTNCA